MSKLFRRLETDDRAAFVVIAAGVTLHAIVASGDIRYDTAHKVKSAFDIAEHFVAEAEARYGQ